MEDWQREIIKKNLRKLIEQTICNKTFLTSLVSKYVISEEDKENIESCQGNTNKADELYRIIVTRENGYVEVRNALIETRQTGAASLLKELKFLEIGSLCDIKSLSEDQILNDVKKHNLRIVRGNFGPRPVAVKCETGQKQNRLDSASFQLHIDILAKIDYHPNIVRYFTIYFEHCREDLWNVTSVFELCSIDLLKWANEVKVSGNELRLKYFEIKKEILRQISAAFQHLHSNQVAHLNLRPSHILIANTQSLQIKVSNFKKAQFVNPDNSCKLDHSRLSCRDCDWMPIEVVQQWQKSLSAIVLDFKTDIFSLGCVFYFILTFGDHPFGPVLERVSNIIYSNPQIKDLNTGDIISLIKTMIHSNHEDRPSIASIVEQLEACKNISA